jgi:ATP-dependent DNA helicase RecG
MKRSGLDSKALMRLQRNLHEQYLHQIGENLPHTLLQQYRLPSRIEAFSNIHFPDNHQALGPAQARLKFEELFFTQMKMVREKLARKASLPGHRISTVGEAFHRFYHETLPFPLTGAQKRVVKELRRDMDTGLQMNRLLQGDVGSGKTIVAAMAMLLVHDNGYQSALMAPTEILATQHYQSLKGMLEEVGLRVGLLTGSTRKAERNALHQALRAGELHVLVGTHALLEEAVRFENLGLVVIDEQHRFGVAQRARMYAKNTTPPHILVMTATPIPRTLALTVYGDLDVSVIDELPPGRKPVTTRHVIEAERPSVFGFLKKQLAMGRQVYIVYPLIEESSELDYNNLMEGYEAVSRAFPPPQYQISIVHGRMRPEDKEAEMQRFKRGETHIMVATTVIEVGVDVPNASVMVIENAERFGLSQLHQLRGRVGRGAAQSYCVLMSKNNIGEDARKRLETMVHTNDGFRVAEVDMQLRGPGDMNGTQQSGLVDFKIADLNTDQKHLKAARRAVEDILAEDPELALPVHRPVREYLATMEKNQTRWSLIG